MRIVSRGVASRGVAMRVMRMIVRMLAGQGGVRRGGALRIVCVHVPEGQDDLSRHCDKGEPDQPATVFPEDVHRYNITKAGPPW